MTKTYSYDPPVNDPREEGVKHWDQIRGELMTTRDELRAAELELESKNRIIEDLVKSNERLTALREKDQAECLTLRTSLQNIGHMILTVLKVGQAARTGPEAYKPSTELQKTLATQIEEVESLLQGNAPKFLTDRSPDQQIVQ